MTNTNLIVVYDACILYPFYLRDFLVHIAKWSNLFRAKWSDDIHEEWISSLLKNRSDIDVQKLHRTRELMDKMLPDSLIPRYRYEQYINSIHLPDLKDRHVVAAAITCKAQSIIIFNIDDFPQDALNDYDLEATHPDDFLSNLINLDAGIVTTCFYRMQMFYKNPPLSKSELLEILSKAGLPDTSTLLQDIL